VKSRKLYSRCLGVNSQPAGEDADLTEEADLLSSASFGRVPGTNGMFSGFKVSAAQICIGQIDAALVCREQW
jgi:hypothetical protein